MILTGAVGMLLVACCSAASAGTLPVGHVARCVAGSQRDPLEVQRGVYDLRIGDRRVALVGELELQLSQRRDLTRDLLEAALCMLTQVGRDWAVAALDLDAHSGLPCRCRRETDATPPGA